VEFDRDIPKLKYGSGVGSEQGLEPAQIYNLSRSCGNYVFRNNAFVRGRRIGILAKSGPGLIENNRFKENCTGIIEE